MFVKKHAWGYFFLFKDNETNSHELKTGFINRYEIQKYVRAFFIILCFFFFFSCLFYISSKPGR